ncbi:MAG TPA: hypothetical protein VMO00_20670, partial [Methylomirabilota bacterium]|nr:hypothetical protein [Methylomirabilota bacterium]
AAGEAESRKLGEHMDRSGNEARDAVQADPKQRIVTLTLEQAASWRERVKPVITEAVEKLPGGQKVLDTYVRFLAEVKEEAKEKVGR